MLDIWWIIFRERLELKDLVDHQAHMWVSVLLKVSIKYKKDALYIDVHVLRANWVPEELKVSWA